ncbi:hypothetical protein BS78_08G046200 [Paspalum vaginatum]|nr:hypothetical protein BS78_08G046200 [Paspalum vaginatum]
MELEDVTFQLLEEITDGFSEERKIGDGAFGVVYRGSTKSCVDVAVKKLRDSVTDLDQNKQFQNEFDNLRKLKHQNIVRLFGYCYEIERKHMEYNGINVLVEHTHRALCLEYLHNGSLQNHLSDESSGFDWNTRYNIIKGTCEGLKHMHKGHGQQPIYHLDLKPANILLDNNMVPKLADFGLSRIFHDKELTRTTKHRVGTLGFQPPEYIERDEISEKFDIFSLGVVMIWILSGSKKCATMAREEFIELVKRNWRSRLQETWSGSSLEAYCHQVETCIQIALSCVETDAHKRPDILKVIHMLHEVEIDSGEHSENPMMYDKMDMQLDPHDTDDPKQHFNLMTTTGYNGMEFVDIRETSLDVGEEFIVGRTEEKKEIMASLHQRKISNITILPIYGIGGIGKTTFAKLIYNDTNFNDYSRVWVSVSPRFDLNKIGNSIISQLSGDESQINVIWMINHRLAELLSGKKKILMVLDDLWEDNLFQLDDLKNMLNPGDSNIIVLVTTRDKNVADRISTNTKPRQIKPLPSDMCWDIIKQRSGFEARDDKEQLKYVGKEIALKCGGVALAAQSIGFMLRPLKLDQWMEVKDSEIWHESISMDATLPNHVLASLKLSCSKMTPCLMLCFTYCAVFPKGHEIIKEDLIHQWISLGFIGPKKLHSTVQICEKYVMHLLGLSFLQHPIMPATTKGALASERGVTSFTMHHLVHDLATILLGSKILNASNTGGGRDYRYAWLTDCSKPLKSLTDAPVTIDALHFRDCAFKSLEDDAFLPARSLQVLDLSGFYVVHLPDSIGELVHLRYLKAPRIQNEMLPHSFTKLSELIYLNLSGSDISALPDSIGEIKGLMHLDISGCGNMRELPASFVNLKNLAHLDLSQHERIKITTQVFGVLTNIQHLNLSKNTGLGSDGFEGLQDVISRLTELRYLGLSGHPWAQISRMVDRICTLPNLLHLDLSDTRGLVRVPESIVSLRKLHTLDVSGCWELEMFPECMLKMESLKVVHVDECDRLDKSRLPGSKCFASLPYFVVNADDGESSSNIGLLRHVNPINLHIIRLDNVMSAEEAHGIKLSKKNEMSYLTLEWTRDARRRVEDVQVLGKLVPPVTLRHFELRGYHSVSFPTWIMDDITCYRHCLTKIVLWELRKCNRLPPLGQLLSLKELVMGRMDSIVAIEEDFCCSGLGLEKFHLCEMENLEVWNTTYYYCHDDDDDDDLWSTTSYYQDDDDDGNNDEDDEHGNGDEDDVQEQFMFPYLVELLIRDCPKLRLKPCPPKAQKWEIENSDNVLSSWDEERVIDLAALLPSRNKRRKFWQGKTIVPPDLRAQWEKCTTPGASYNACPENLEVKSSKVPLEQWGLFRHLLPTYHLQITCCTYLTSSPSKEIDRDLSYIRSLRLEDDAQHELPKWLGELRYLEKLEIARCPGLEAQVESMGQLTFLRELRLIDCGRLSTLPQWLGELTCLKRLAVSHCTDLSDFPESLRRLTSLRELCLEGCPRVTALPEWLGDVASLEKLSIEDCGGIESVPKSLRRLTSLRELCLKGCPRIIALPEWLGDVASLVKLGIEDCGGIESLPESMRHLTSLRELCLEDCPRITALPEWLGDLASLNKLSIRDYGSIESLPESIQMLTGLKLIITGSGKLVQWWALAKNKKAQSVSEGGEGDRTPHFGGPPFYRQLRYSSERSSAQAARPFQRPFRGRSISPTNTERRLPDPDLKRNDSSTSLQTVPSPTSDPPCPKAPTSFRLRRRRRRHLRVMNLGTWRRHWWAGPSHSRRRHLRVMNIGTWRRHWRAGPSHSYLSHL